MSAWESFVEFYIPMTKEEAEFAERLFSTCNFLKFAAMRNSAATGRELYDSVQFVPEDLVEYVKRIDPLSIGDLGVEAEFEEGEGLYVRENGPINIEAIVACVTEILRKYDHLGPIECEWWNRPDRDSATYLAGRCTVSTDGPRYWTSKT